MRVIVLRAEGEHFSSGGYIKGFPTPLRARFEARLEHGGAGPLLEARHRRQPGLHVRCRLRDLAGLRFPHRLRDLPLRASRTEARPDSRLRRLGRLQKIVGITRTKDIVMRSKRIPGRQASRLGHRHRMRTRCGPGEGHRRPRGGTARLLAHRPAHRQEAPQRHRGREPVHRHRARRTLLQPPSSGRRLPRGASRRSTPSARRASRLIVRPRRGGLPSGSPHPVTPTAPLRSPPRRETTAHARMAPAQTQSRNGPPRQRPHPRRKSMQTAATFASDPPPSPNPQAGRRVTAAMASLFGWGLDLFDLFILLYVAPVVGTLFFPADKPMLSLAGAYASFAVTLLIRPLGSACSVLCGPFGRRRALMVAVVGVGISTRSSVSCRRSARSDGSRLRSSFSSASSRASSSAASSRHPHDRYGIRVGAVAGADVRGGRRWRLGHRRPACLPGLLCRLAHGAGEAFADWVAADVLLGSPDLGDRLILFRNLGNPRSSRICRPGRRRSGAGAPAEASPIRSLFSPSNRGSFAVATSHLLRWWRSLLPYVRLPADPPQARERRAERHRLDDPDRRQRRGGDRRLRLMGELSQHIGRKRSFLLMGAIRLLAFPALFLTMANTTSLVGVAACAFCWRSSPTPATGRC